MAEATHRTVLSELEHGPFAAALRLKIEACGEGDAAVRMPFGEALLNAGADPRRWRTPRRPPRCSPILFVSFPLH